jgi:ribonuclease T2
MRSFVRWLISITSICLCAAIAEPARSHRKAQESTPAFSYYLLSLSYAPDFCAQPSANKDPRECGAGRHIGFVVHGLWPQVEGGRGPENCGPARPVSQDIVRATLGYMPTESLIQHEWTTHGCCTGLTVSDYFTFVRRARDMIKIPDSLQAPTRELRLNPEEIEARMAASNPNFPRGAFRVACYRDAALEEVRIALNKDLSPRIYGSGGGSCRTTVIIRPVR